MKTLLISVILIVSFVACLFSQNVEPEAMYFSIPRSSGTNIQQFDINDPEYIMNKFTLTWQWNNSPKLTRALKMNCSQGHEPSWGADSLRPNDTGREVEYIWQPVEFSGTPHPLYYSKSFTYKPTFTVDPDNFSPNANDAEKNIWGFKNRNITNPLIINNRLRLSRLTQCTNPVLTNPWRSDNFYTKVGQTQEAIDTNINGKYWRVSINLRRASFSSMNDTSDNAPVLSIVIPYYMTSGSTISNGKIQFNTVPNPGNRSEMQYQYSVGSNNYVVSRGFELGTVSTPTDSLIITRNMLPNSTDSIGPDITISFSFIASDPAINNPLFKSNADDKTINRIDSIGLDVHYHKTCDIHLNYIRIGNPMSHKLWKGELDPLFHSKIQTGINIIKDKGYKLVRFYGRDEIDEHYELWDAMRYFNKLVGGLALGWSIKQTMKCIFKNSVCIKKVFTNLRLIKTFVIPRGFEPLLPA